MPRRVRELSNIEIDEVSLVDRPANQHARVAIAKRATEEENVPEIYSEDGQLLDETQLEHGDVVYDTEGNAYMFVVDEDEDETPEVEDRKPEPAGVSKAADLFVKKSEPKQPSLADKVREDLSKALTDLDRDEVISKAMEEVSKAEERARAAEEIAKAERDLRLTKEYVAKAATYKLPVESGELGPVLMRMAETMSYDDCAVIAKALESASEAISYMSEELGYQGGGDNNEVMSQIDAFLGDKVSKGDVSKAQALEGFFEENPRAYDEYLASRNLR
jgi:hypothetical protein